MPYTYTAALSLGTGQAGQAGALRAALRDGAGAIHPTLRDIAAGFVEDGGGSYGFSSSAFPDGYRGRVVFYTGTLGGASDFSGVSVKASATVTPEDLGHLADGAVTEAKITLPAEAPGSPAGALSLLMWLAAMFGWRKVVKDETTIKAYMPDGTTVKTSSTYTSEGGVDTINKAV